jgi:hypothetical protein
MCKQNPHIVYTCINRDCRQINCPSIADLSCDCFNPFSHHVWVEVYMFIVVKFYNRYSTILSTNIHALPFNGCDQCSLLVWYNTLSHFYWTSSQMKNKIYLLSAPPQKKVSDLYSIWTTQLKMWQGKAWARLSYTIHILAIDHTKIETIIYN